VVNPYYHTMECLDQIKFRSNEIRVEGTGVWVETIFVFSKTVCI
jgi:hypothetical protein